MPADRRALKTTLLSRHLATSDTRRKTVAWAVWQCADAIYSHEYDKEVSFLVLAGCALIELSSGDRVDVLPGDFVTIRPGISCRWHISEPMENRYCYHDSFEIAERRALLSSPQDQSHDQ
ncbi:putative cupin superfamily protein [Pseudomonas sp. JUb42]|jgi:uncharacterized cupin superfamily protein|uniref:cupin domain-containing protein n=1 Tax=Pseudomonas sp. JUb42 TaxID=2940611 RepID=UPI00216925D1|nr:cupin domain-containing protein [Pseudomonas sp. JUb42]MCS3470113.1 putative cupin superfamily protein [Pseudomonas sp. JUb42]